MNSHNEGSINEDKKLNKYIIIGQSISRGEENTAIENFSKLPKI